MFDVKIIIKHQIITTLQRINTSAEITFEAMWWDLSNLNTYSSETQDIRM